MKPPEGQGFGTGTSAAAANEIVEDLVRPTVLVDTGKAGWRGVLKEAALNEASFGTSHIAILEQGAASLRAFASCVTLAWLAAWLEENSLRGPALKVC